MPKIRCLSPKIENYSPKSDTNAQDWTQNLDDSLSNISVLNQTFVLHLPKMDTGVQSWTLVPRNYGTLVSKFGHWSLKLDTSVQNSEI